MGIRTFEDKKISTARISSNSSSIAEAVTVLSKKLLGLQKELCLANTRTAFDSVAKKLIRQGKELQQFLISSAPGVKPESKSSSLSHSEYAILLAKYKIGALERISEKKETISLEGTLKNLSEPQKNEARNFIKSLRELYFVAETLMSQEEAFKKRLSEADSLEVIEQLETEILQKNAIIEGALSRLVPYPQDEAVAGVLVRFLQTHDSLLTLMQSFDLYASLEEDLANARAALKVHHQPF